MSLKCKIRHKSPKKVESAKKLSIVDTFGSFMERYTSFVCLSDSVRQTIFLFVAVIQSNKLNLRLSQWLSAKTIFTNKFYLLVACAKGIGKKAKKKHPSKFEFHQRYQIALGYIFFNIFRKV